MKAAPWSELDAPSQALLRKASLLPSRPAPLEVLGPQRSDLEPAAAKGYLVLEAHDLWQEAVRLPDAARKGIPPASEEEKRELVRRVKDAFFGYFVWPPTEMIQNAQEMEPHLEAALGLARPLKMWEEISQIQHQRALFDAWKTQKFAKALEYATEAVAAFRRTNGGAPHPGTLAMILTGLASWQQYGKHYPEALKTLREAEGLLIPAVGKQTIEPFLLYCQIGTVCARMDDLDGMKAAQEEAWKIAQIIDGPRLEKHIHQTLSWAQWHLQHYIGL